MKRVMSPAMCALLAISILAAAPYAVAQERTAADRESLNRLQAILPTVEFEGSTLDEVIGFFRQSTGVSIHVKWAMLDPSGIDGADPVSLSLKNVRAAKALDLLIQSLSRAEPLGYTIDEGIVIISTRSDLGGLVDTRVRNVDDLIGTDDPQQRAKRFYDLLDIIRTSIDVDSWISKGGISASLKVFDGMIIVTQTSSNHRAIDELLTHLRQVKADRPPTPPTPRQRTKQTTSMVELVEVMRKASFDPTGMGLIAIGGLKEDVKRDEADIAADLETLLGGVKTLGLRNSIRLTLSDLYRQTGEDEKVLANYRALLMENDEAAKAEEEHDTPLH